MEHGSQTGLQSYFLVGRSAFLTSVDPPVCTQNHSQEQGGWSRALTAVISAIYFALKDVGYLKRKTSRGLASHDSHEDWHIKVLPWAIGIRANLYFKELMATGSENSAWLAFNSGSTKGFSTM
jgi:hypothetical protein